MRDMLQKVTVLEGAGFMLAGIADEVSLLDAMVEHLVPLDAGRKTRAATPPQTGRLDLAHNVIRRQVFQALSPGIIAAGFEVRVDFPGRPVKLLQYPWLR